jgi:hypothetical protein
MQEGHLLRLLQQALHTILSFEIGGWYEKGGMIGWDAQTSTHAAGGKRTIYKAAGSVELGMTINVSVKS